MRMAVAAVLVAASVMPSPIPLPDGTGGIGLDDLVYSRELHALLVPAGRTGRLDLVDPATRAIASVGGFSRAAPASRGHGDGTTSADAGHGHLFAIDRTARALAVVDPVERRIVARADLAGAPDYVRWVGGANDEVWVTEPRRKAIEIFRIDEASPPRLTSAGSISLPEGPESLVVDPKGDRAYTNTFHGETLAIDVGAHALAARWPNHCRGARGIALDARRGLLFVGCDEGKVVALDLAHGGATVGTAKAGTGIDGIAYSPELGHLYVPAAESASLTIVGVDARGALRDLGTSPAAPGAHCAAADDRGNAYVCDPEGGRLLVFHDPHPASPASTRARAQGG